MVRVVQENNLFMVYSNLFLYFEWKLEESDLKPNLILRSPSFNIGGERASFLEINLVRYKNFGFDFYYMQPFGNGNCVFIIYDKNNSHIKSIIYEPINFSTDNVRTVLFADYTKSLSYIRYPVTINGIARSSKTDLLKQLYVDHDIKMNTLSSDLMKILDQSYNTDVKLSTGGENIKAHRIILQARSPMFRKMFEHDTSETAKSTVDVSDINPPTMKRLVKFLYSGEMERCNFDEVTQLYYAADKYEVMSLLEDCRAKLLNHLDLNNANFLLFLANRHNDAVFEEKVVQFVSANFMSIINMDSFLELSNENIGLFMRLCVPAIKK